MINFVLRFTVFILFWILMLFDHHGAHIVSLLFLTISLAFFFFLSNRHVSFYVYVILSILIFVHGWIVNDLFYTAMMLLLISILASFREFKLKFYSLLGLNFILVIFLALHTGGSLLFTMITLVMFGFFLLYFGKINQGKNERQAMYEQLLAEYRSLKRMHITTEEVAKSEERTRIAREIHDSVGHRLTALMMKIEMLHIEQPDERLLELKAMANDSLQETREAVHALQTTDAVGLSAIVGLIRKLEAESQLLIELTVKEGVLSVPLSNEQGVVLYRVIQEALTNVMRHSRSKNVSIEIGKAAIEGFKFTIKNPLDSKRQFTKGFGIENMYARIEELGGKLDVYQTEDQFIVSGYLPIGGGDTSVAHTYRR